MKASIIALVVAALSASSVSGVCVCPATDKGGFALAQASQCCGIISCSYPGVAGQDPFLYFCTYDSATGILIQDRNAGLCQPSTTTGCARPGAAASARLTAASKGKPQA